jgi:SagB-type dehydrogenase family enzyme
MIACSTAYWAAQAASPDGGLPVTRPKHTVDLPAPRKDGTYSLERSLSERRSIRDFRGAALTLAEISQLLWAAQGVTGTGGLRTAPSAGALYPLEVYLVVGNIQHVAAGVYKFEPLEHRLAQIGTEDRRGDLAGAAYDQEWVAEGAALLMFTGVERRTTGKYGERGVRYVHMEAGHAAQNVLLQAVALGLGGAVVGAFEDDRVREVLSLPKGEQPLYLIPLGRPQ